jgi:two-component system, chemotaxis family, chemotaxis protein CheY
VDEPAATTAQALVVDDDESIREFVEMVLSDAGWTVHTAPHGRAALDLVARCPPDLILLDMAMPVLDGWGFARAYRETAGPRAPIVVMTAAWNAAERAAQVDADQYLAKPFDLDELLQIVRQYGDSPARSRPSGSDH